MNNTTSLRQYKMRLTSTCVLWLFIVVLLAHTEPEFSYLKDLRMTRKVPSEYATLNEAILHANEGDIILISASTAVNFPVVIDTKELQIVCDEGVNLTYPQKSPAFIMKVEELNIPNCPDRSPMFRLDFNMQRPFEEN